MERDLTPDELDRMMANDINEADQRRLSEMFSVSDHACSTGDCGHDTQAQCNSKLAADYPEFGPEFPYSDSGAVQKQWVKLFHHNDDGWLWGFDFDVAGHSKNWCMGTLNIDIFSVSFDFGPWSIFWAYRLVINPPRNKGE